VITTGTGSPFHTEGAVNRTTTTIANGTLDPSPLVIRSISDLFGFGSSVANGVVSAIQNAVTNVAVDITIQASDRASGSSTTRSAKRNWLGTDSHVRYRFIGDGVPIDSICNLSAWYECRPRLDSSCHWYRFPACYEFEDLEEGEIELDTISVASQFDL